MIRLLLLLGLAVLHVAKAEPDAATRADADRRLRIVLADPTFPDSYSTDFPDFRKRIEKIRGPEGVAVLEEAAKALARIRPRVSSENYQKISRDALDSLDYVLPTVSKDYQANFYTHLFRNYADENNDTSKFYLKPEIFEAVASRRTGLTPTNIEALNYLFQGESSPKEVTLRTVQWFPEVMLPRIEQLVEIESASQMEVLRKWGEDPKFNFWLRSNYGGAYVNRLLQLLAANPMPEEVPALLGVGRFLAARQNHESSLYTEKYGIASSAETSAIDANRAVLLVDDLAEKLGNVKQLPNHPQLRHQAFGVISEALGEYNGHYLGRDGQRKKEKIEEVLQGTGIGNELLTSVNRVSSPLDLQVLTQLVITRNKDGEVEIDSRWLSKMGSYADLAAVRADIAKYKPNSFPFETQAEKKGQQDQTRGRNIILRFAEFCLGKGK